SECADLRHQRQHLFRTTDCYHEHRLRGRQPGIEHQPESDSGRRAVLYQRYWHRWSEWIANGLVPTQWGNVGPRIGFAYDLTGQGKTILRGGFGTMYERIQGND